MNQSCQRVVRIAEGGAGERIRREEAQHRLLVLQQPRLGVDAFRAEQARICDMPLALAG